MGGPKSREAHGPGVLVVPNGDGGNGLTQADCNVCRWLVDHGPGDRVRRGRVGEGEQVARCRSCEVREMRKAEADLPIIQALRGSGHWRAT